MEIVTKRKKKKNDNRTADSKRDYTKETITELKKDRYFVDESCCAEGNDIGGREKTIKQGKRKILCWVCGMFEQCTDKIEDIVVGGTK